MRRVIRRAWESTGTVVPYPNTHDLKLGDHWWRDPLRGPKFTQHFVRLPHGRAATPEDPIVYDDDLAAGVAYIPPEAAIARELLASGAAWAVWGDVFCGKRVFVDARLIRVEPPHALETILEQLRSATRRPMLGGLPDVIGGFKDGRLLFREAKHVSKRYKDKWGPKQEEVAALAEQLWPAKVDVAIVEWGTSAIRTPSVESLKPEPPLT